MNFFMKVCFCNNTFFNLHYIIKFMTFLIINLIDKGVKTYFRNFKKLFYK